MIEGPVQAHREARIDECAGVVHRSFGTHGVGTQAAELRFARLSAFDDQIALGLGQQAGIFDVEIEIETALVTNPQEGEFLFVASEAAPVRTLDFDFGGNASEVRFEQDIHDALISRIAEPLGRFFREDFHFADSFGRIAAKFAPARYSDAIDQENRASASPRTACAATRRRFNGSDYIGNTAGTECRDVFFVEFGDGFFFNEQLAANARTLDDNQVGRSRRNRHFFRFRILGDGRILLFCKNGRRGAQKCERQRDRGGPGT